MNGEKVFSKEVNGETTNFREVTTTRVVANPEESGTDELNKITIGNTTYDIAGLSVEERNKLARALLTPVSAPSDTEIVAVGSNGAQMMLGIGNGLSIQNGKLSATALGSSVKVFSLNNPTSIAGYTFFDDWKTNPQNYAFLITRNNATLLYTLAKKQDGSQLYQAFYDTNTSNISCVINFYVMYISQSGTITHQSLQTLYLPYKEWKGLQVKEITFTDRPSLYAWLQSKADKIIKLRGSYTSPQGTVSADFNNVVLNNEVYSISGFRCFVGQYNQEFSNVYYLYYVQVASTHIVLCLGANLRATADETISAHYKENEIIPDDYWSILSLRVTILYYE